MSIPELNTIEILLHGPESHDAHIAEIRLSRLDRSNAMNDAMWHELRKAFQWADAESEVRVVLLTGAGEESVVTVLAKPNAKLGLIFLDVKRAAEAVTKML